MMLTAIFLLIIICLVRGKEITISDIGEDSHLCLEGMHPCRSLEYIANTSNIDNMVIRINSTNYTLHGVAQFTGVDNITITGQDQSTTIITCSSVTNTTRGAGLAFENASLITLEHFTIANCSLVVKKSTLNKTGLISNETAILFWKCERVYIDQVIVSNSSGQGVTMFSVSSDVNITKSQFRSNGLTSGGGGVSFHIPNCVRLNESCKSSILISDSNFTSNNASTEEIEQYIHGNYTNRGGAVRITIFSQFCKQVQVQIVHSYFTKNNGLIGGGLYICLSDKVMNHSISIQNSFFTENQARKIGGGASVDYTSWYKSPRQNTITFRRVEFSHNNSTLGGGLAIQTSMTDITTKLDLNEIKCSFCDFSNNTAYGGAAIQVSEANVNIVGKNPLTLVKFHSCNFSENEATNSGHALGDYQGFGTVRTFNIYIYFSGDTIFKNNKNTALCVESADVNIASNSMMKFVNNTGNKGGAILLLCDSSLDMQNDTQIQFYNNTALYGGAIYSFHKDLRTFPFLETCFLKKTNSYPTLYNISFHFKNNNATLVGRNIFATSFQPCLEHCKSVKKNTTTIQIKDIFANSCIWSFDFQSTINDIDDYGMATTPKSIKTNTQEQPLSIAPGIELSINLSLCDELDNCKMYKYFQVVAHLQNAGPLVSIDQEHLVITNSTIKLHGEPGHEGDLVLETLTMPSVQNIIKFKLVDCPPGYNLTEENKNSICKCNTKIKGLSCYNNSAQLQIGHWIGTIDHSNDSMLSVPVYQGICPLKLCKNSKISVGLPKNYTLLSEILCTNNRTGILCGKCTGNNSVYYHSNNFTCGDNNLCSYGILFYILTDLLPVTIFFLIILVCNISLTSGALYSFVFYAQTVSAIDITAFGVIKDSSLVNFQKLYSLLNYLDLNFASFCIVQTQSLMDLMMFKYATTLYTFLLILGTIFILKIHTCYKCVLMCRRCGRRNIRGSIVDGLCTFLVLGYVQCALTTTKVLGQTSLLNVANQTEKLYAAFDGELEYLHGKHLAYAVPAILCIVLILLPPPVILILEPFLTKLFSLKHIRKTTIRLLYDRLRLKLMPFLDSFQACFQDKHRYFAGLYFVYRLIPSIILLFSPNVIILFGLTILIIFGMLFLHSIVLPYKNKWHSQFELFLLINLVMIYCLSLTNYLCALMNVPNEYSKYKHVLVPIQIILLVLPIAFLCCYIAGLLCRKILKNKICRTVRWRRNLSEYDYGFPDRILIDKSYSTF